MEQMKQRQIKGILNKLTPQNFEKLFAQVKDVNIDSALTLMGVISQIFDKALTEPTFCEMYATFCAELAIVLPEFVEDDEKITFRRVLLNKCQEEFERGEREQEEAEKVEPEGETQLDPKEREEKRSSARRRMLGNIRFIGELYKKSMLTERIMHECIKKLLGEYQHPDEEDVEALCKLMRTIGHIIDHPKARDHIDAYFRRMESLSVNMELPSRIRFMLKDMIDLRRDGWQERRKVEGPKKIDEVHRDAVQERQQAMANTGGRDRFSRGSIIGGLGRGRIVPGSDFGMRGGPPAPLFPPNPRMAAGQIPSAMTLTSSEICSN
jgi:translation initiation factor 4G